MRQRFPNWRAKRCWSWRISVTLLMAAIGCGSATSGSTGNAAITPVSEEGAAPKGNAIADPALREARDEAEALLLGQRSGAFDQDEHLAAVAETAEGN